MGRTYEEDRRILVYRVGRKIYFFDEINADSVCEAIKYLEHMQL